MSSDAWGEQLADTLTSEFSIQMSRPTDRRIWLHFDEEDIMKLCEYLKDAGFDHLSALSVTDWPDENVFQLSYHLWSYQQKVLLTAQTTIDRDEATISSVVSLWPSAQIHEREQHELFGVQFAGNPDLSELFLEDWDELPPFRKDFNWREYVKGSYGDSDRERIYREG